jgi:hypothetical protein
MFNITTPPDGTPSKIEGELASVAAACRGRSILRAPVFLLFEHASLSCFIFDSDDKTYRLFPPQRYKTFPGKSRGKLF